MKNGRVGQDHLKGLQVYSWFSAGVCMGVMPSVLFLKDYRIKKKASYRNEWCEQSEGGWVCTDFSLHSLR